MDRSWLFENFLVSNEDDFGRRRGGNIGIFGMKKVLGIECWL